MSQVKDLVDAIDAFIVGCKDDAIWDAIKACCIMAAWDGLSGCLVPLKGAAPTNNNFVSGDYNRETGLVGDGATKYLDSNRAANADPLNDMHLSVYITENRETSFPSYIGGGTLNRLLGSTTGFGAAANNTFVYVGTGTAIPSTIALSRNNSANFDWRGLGQNGTSTTASTSATSTSITVFAQNATNRTSARLSFYSIGEALDLALLDSRVSTLMTAIGAAIP